MLNILVPLAGESAFFENSNYIFPKPLAEVRGKPMIQGVIEDLGNIEAEKRYVFIVNGSDCKQYHLDSVLKLLAGECSVQVRIDKQTAGAACSSLLAIDYINNDDALIISNADQCFDQNLNDYITRFQNRNLDAGVICFESVHPRWSYVATDKNGLVIEASEKRPISRDAVAGIFYFKHGRYFVDAAMKSITKGASVDGKFYIAPVLNELILDSKKIGIEHIDNNDYHTFYSPQMLEDYNNKVHR